MENIEVVNSKDVAVQQITDVRYYINKFLNRDIAEKTIADYKHDIKEFFGCSINQITLDMIIDTSIDSVEQYRDNLILSGLNIGSVRTKLNRLKALFEYLMNQSIDNRYRIRLLVANPFSGVKVNQNGRYVDDTNKVKKYGSFTKQECIELIKIAKAPYDLLYELAIRTGIRKNALLNLTTDEIVQKDGIWCIFIEWDKTKGDIYEAIPDKLYDKIIEYASFDGRVFTMSQATINNTLKRDCEAINISKEDQKKRRLTFHSFKKSSVILANEYSNGNLVVMKNKAHHSDVSLTIDTYTTEEYNPNEEISLKYNLSDNENSDEELSLKLTNLSSEELISIILSLDENQKSRISNKLKEVLV